MIHTPPLDCKHCGEQIRLLGPGDPVGMGPEPDGRQPGIGDWAGLVTGISCPGADDHGSGARHTPATVDEELLSLVVHTVRENAAALARPRAHAGASWVFDGNTDADTYRRCLDLDEDGDPAWEEQFGPREAILPNEDEGRALDETDEGSLPWLLDTLGVVELLAVADAGGVHTGPYRAELADAYDTAFRETWRDEVLVLATGHIDSDPATESETESDNHTG
jgi:hypothetical protein